MLQPGPPPPVGAGTAVQERRTELRRCDAQQAPRTARAFTRDVGSEWGLDEDLVDTLLLLVSEMVTNAVRYAPPPLELALARGPDGVRVELCDSDPRLPEPKRPDHEQLGGRGLWLVEVLADEWGFQRVPAGKRVWFVIDEALVRRPPARD